MTATKTFILVLLFSAITGCANAPLTVDKLQNFSSDSKTLVLLESTRFDVKIRKALAKKGFKALKFSSTQKVIIEGGKGEIVRLYDEAEARYGLTFYWDKFDWCSTGVNIIGTFEITDLKTNEVVMVVEKGGWTGPCLGHKGGIFDDLSQALLDNWGK